MLRVRRGGVISAFARIFSLILVIMFVKELAFQILFDSSDCVVDDVVQTLRPRRTATAGADRGDDRINCRISFKDIVFRMLWLRICLFSLVISLFVNFFDDGAARRRTFRRSFAKKNFVCDNEKSSTVSSSAARGFSLSLFYALKSCACVT